jgi:hypothetical protein
MWQGAWPSLAVSDLRRGVRDLRGLVDEVSASGESPQVSAALNRFLVVRVCGFLEQMIEESVKAYITSKADPRVASHASAIFARGMNPTPGNIIDMVRRFDPAWAVELTSLLEADDSRLHRQLAFLVDRRNKIAHGLSESLSTAKALQLETDVQLVADWFAERFDPR